MRFHRFAKSIIAVYICTSVILSVISSVLAEGIVIKGEPDGQNKSTVMDEHFYSGSLEPNFTSDSVSVNTESYGMHFDGAYHYGSALVLTAYKLKKYNKFTFSVDMLETQDGFIYCGFGGPDEKKTVGYYDCNFCFSSGVTALYENGGFDKWNMIGSAPLNNALKVGKTTDFAVTLKKASGNKYKITFEILEKGKTVMSTDYGTTVRMENQNGYFCMWNAQGEKFNLRNFKAYDSPEHIAFSDDFKNSSLTYGDEAVGKSNWHINNTEYTKSELFIARNAGPDFKKANDTITAKSKLIPCNKVSKPYEISFKAEIKSLDKNSTFGFYFGAEKAGDISKATVIGVSAYDGKNASVNLIKNGKKINYGDSFIPQNLLNIDETTVDFKVVILSDYSLVFTVGGVQFSFTNIEYGGYWGICDYSFDSRSASVVKLNEVNVLKNTYTGCKEPDLSNDFAGIKPTQDGFEEYYISDRTYYIGPAVSLRPKGAFTTEPSLYFENAGPYSSFSTKAKYTDFILQFDVKTVSKGANGQSFGVSFGKENYASIANYSTCINFAYNGWSDTPYTHMATNLCSFDDGMKEKKIEGYHFYKDQDTKYNFMIVAKNRTVYVYFKEDSEDISKLGICRAVIPDVNTAGYVSVYGTNGVSFDLFNYKLTNISAEATKDSDIALRESFDGDKISEKLATDGSAQIKDGAMELTGGSIKTKNKHRYYIANFTVLKSDRDLSFEFAGNKSLVFSKDLNKITVKDGANSKVFDVSEYNLEDYKNIQFQLILQYDSLSVAAKGVYEPCDKLSSPILEYSFSKPVEEGILGWSSEGALIDDISVYALDNSYKAANISFEQDPNDGDIWVSKLSDKKDKSADSQSDTGIPALFIIIYSVIGGIILVLSAVLIILSVKKRGKVQ